MSWQIIVHAGAGASPEDMAEREQICREVVETAGGMLAGGGMALDACEKAVCLLEDAAALNAGRGSYLQIDGEVRMDACLMTSGPALGSVVQISGVRHPISVARRLLEMGYHCSLSGEGAVRFAREMGFAPYDPRTPGKIETHRKVLETLNHDTSYRNLAGYGARGDGGRMGTVGCVARDEAGQIVAGTSTGGRKACFPGRVGDTALPGCGNWADEYAGISCTGVGEDIMRVTLARLVAFGVEGGQTLAQACDRAMERLTALPGQGGLIAISRSGELAARFNTAAMPWASAAG